MSRINRRALLLSSGSAVIASTVAAAALATQPRRLDREPSRDLRVLIKAQGDLRGVRQGNPRKGRQ
jgi:hypothetical protein